MTVGEVSEAVVRATGTVAKVYKTVDRISGTVGGVSEAVGVTEIIVGEPFVVPFPTYLVVFVIVDGDDVEGTFTVFVVTEG